MALEEANAIVKSLLEEELEPDKRARLVALQLALGWPHALDVQPEHLEELRWVERSLPAWRAQVWLGAASVLAFAWSAGGMVFWAIFMWSDPTMAVFFAAFVLGLVHSVVGLIEAFCQVRAINPRSVGVLSRMWLCGPLLATTAAIGFDGNAFFGGLLCATPSMLVSLAASRVARHTAVR